MFFTFVAFLVVCVGAWASNPILDYLLQGNDPSEEELISHPRIQFKRSMVWGPVILIAGVVMLIASRF